MPGWYAKLSDMVWSSVAAWLFMVLGIVEALSSDPKIEYITAVGLAAVTNAILSLRE